MLCKCSSIAYFYLVLIFITHKFYNSLIKSNSNLMKKMTFIFRGLLKGSLLLLMFVFAQDLHAQTETDMVNFSPSTTVSKDTPSVANANLVSSSVAISNLNNAAMLHRDNVSNATTTADKLSNEVKMRYFRHIAGLINTGSTVASAMNLSGAYLNQLLSKFDDTYGLSADDLFQEALDLVSQ